MSTSQHSRAVDVAAHTGRHFTAPELAEIGDALTDRITLAVKAEVKPLVDRFDALDRRASLAGLLGGIVTALGSILYGRWHT